MEMSEDERSFIAALGEGAVAVGDGSDGVPVWVGVDAARHKVYKVYADGSTAGFGDGSLVIFNGRSALCQFGYPQAQQVTVGPDAMFGDKNRQFWFDLRSRSANEPADD